jgi:demethylmenaquinone methyltransferase/2-methoxy-6-polyprenyl-1,4-benzoquinol methylase
MPTNQAAAAGRMEAGQVQAMFDRIAGVYDLLNGVMTAGLHHRWRARAADLAEIGPGSRVLDVATGTGDLALELAGRVGKTGEVIGSDFSEAMLQRARTKASRAGAGSLCFEWADATALPYPDGSFDAVTVGFGARNFGDLHLGLAEMARVVRPGGRVVVLEITTPTRPPLSIFYRLWFDRLVPGLGHLAEALAKLAGRSHVRGKQGLAGQDTHATIAAAYTYLPNSVKRFPSPSALAADMQSAGLENVSWILTAGGIIAIHSGTVKG